MKYKMKMKIVLPGDVFLYKGHLFLQCLKPRLQRTLRTASDMNNQLHFR